MTMSLAAFLAKSSTGRRRFLMTAAQLRAESHTLDADLKAATAELELLKGHFTELGLAYRAGIQQAADNEIAAQGTEDALADCVSLTASLNAEILALKADIANRDAVTLASMHRDPEETLVTPLPDPEYTPPTKAAGPAIGAMTRVVPLAEAFAIRDLPEPEPAPVGWTALATAGGTR